MFQALARLDPDRLDVEIFLDVLLAGLAAVAAHLVAAERHRRIHRLVAIDPDRAGAQRLRDLVRLADIGGPDAGAEAEGGGVGALDQLVRILERDRRDHRAEDLFLRDAHVVLHIGKHRRLHEIALRERALGEAAAAGKCRGALLLSDVEIAGDAVHLLLRHQRPDLGVGIEAVADLQLLAELGDAADEFVIDLLLDEQARAGAADLPRIGEHGHRGSRHRRIEIGVGEHDVRRLAAELKRNPLEVTGRGTDDRLPRDVRAGEGDLVDIGMRCQRGARGLAIARHDVDDPGWNAGLHAELADAQRGQRRFLRRLQHHGAAGRDRRADLPDRGSQRTVPGDDGADHADRLLQRVGEDLAGQRVLDGLAVDCGGLACVIAQHAERAQPVAAGAADRRAHVERVELGQFLEIGFDQLGELEQHVLPLERLHLAPRPFEGAPRRRNRAVDVLGVALGDGREQFTGGGVVGFEFLAGGGVDPFAVDQHLLVGAVGIRMARDRNCLRNSHVCTPCQIVG